MDAALRASPRSASRRLAVGRDWDRLAWPLFGVILLVAFVYLNFKGRGENFFYDEWGWLLQRRSGLHAIVASYNQHLYAVPIALYQLLFKTVGLAHYWVYRLLQVCAHLATATVVFAFARRRLGILAIPLTLPIVFLGSGAEDILWPVNFGPVTAVGLSVGAMLLLDGDGRGRNALACGLLVVGVACSEVAVGFALGIAVELLWRDRGGRRAWVWLVPLLVYGAWWLGYHESTSSWRHNLTSMPAFAADVAANATGGLFGLDIVWGRSLLVAGIVLLVIQVRRPRVMTPRLVALLVAIGVFWTLVALGRASSGTQAASRYVYPAAMMIVLIAAEALRGTRLRPAAFGVCMLVALFGVTANIRLMTAEHGGLALAARIVSAELTAVEQARGQLPPTLIVDTHYAPVLAVGPYLAAIDALHSSPADSPRQLLRASESVRGAADTLLIRGGQVFTAPATTPLGCRTLRPGAAGPMSDLSLPAIGLIVKAKPGPAVAIRARRFASGYESPPLATIAGGRSVLVRATPDRSPLQWHLQISSRQDVVVCASR